MARLRAGHARPLQGGVNELRAKARPTECGKVGCRAACPQAAADVCGNEKPCGLCCRGRRPRRPAEVRGCERGPTVERSEIGERTMFAPAGQTTALAGQLCWLTALVVRRQAVKTPPYDAKDKRGGNGKVEGRACPAPTDCRKRVADEEGRGRAAARPLFACGGCPGMSGHAHPVGIPQSANAASPL